MFKKIYNLKRTFLPDGSQFDHLFKDGETFMIGGIEAAAWLVPGHTPADMAYLIDGAVYVGDTLFMPDVSSARADFPAATRGSSTARCAGCSRCHQTHRCSSATTTRLPRAGPGGKRA